MYSYDRTGASDEKHLEYADFLRLLGEIFTRSGKSQLSAKSLMALLGEFPEVRRMQERAEEYAKNYVPQQLRVLLLRAQRDIASPLGRINYDYVWRPKKSV